MRTIIVPVDFSPVSLNSVHYALNMAIAMDASLILFNTYQIPLTFTEVPVVTVGVEELSELSRTRLKDLKSSLEHLSSDRIKIYQESRLGDVVSELEAFCEEVDPIAVVMGTTGHGVIHDLFVGGNTVRAMKSLRHPLLIVPSGAVFKKPTDVLLACDMVEVAETMPSKFIHGLLSGFGSKLYVLNVRKGDGGGDGSLEFESLMADTLLSDLDPEYHFIGEVDPADVIQEFAERHNVAWIIVVPRRHTGFESLLRKSVSKELAYQSNIPLVCLHA